MVALLVDDLGPGDVTAHGDLYERSECGRFGGSRDAQRGAGVDLVARERSVVVGDGRERIDEETGRLTRVAGPVPNEPDAVAQRR